MKRKISLITIFLLILSFSANSYGEETKKENVSSEIISLNGLWVGSGKIRMSYNQYVGCPTGNDVPIAFFLRDGKAKSVFKKDVLNFETQVNPKGKIKFTYRYIGSVDRGSGGIDSISMVFRGNLKGSSGKGRFTYGKCKGNWEVNKEDIVSANGVDFTIYKDMVLVSYRDEVINVLKPTEGKKFTEVNTSGDFLAVHVKGEDVDASTFLYRVEGSGKVLKLGDFSGDVNFTKSPGFNEERRIQPAIVEGNLCLYKGEDIIQTIEPAPGRIIESFSACGSFLAVHGRGLDLQDTTTLYYLKEDNFPSLVGIYDGRLNFF